MRKRRIAGFTAAALSVLSAPLAAQWIHQPTPGIPRTADGKPELSAPAPRTPDGKPDLSGLWGLNAGAYVMNIAADLKPEEIQPWAVALRKQRLEDLGKDDPAGFRCLPQGPRFNLLPVLMSKIIQTPSLIAILSEDLTYRQIFLDGRALPKDPSPSFMGYSVGHWEGETLVVESIGYKDTTWLDVGGHSHSEALRTTERYRRRDFGHMEIVETLDDSKVYARPWTITINADFIPDTELIEFVCAENEKDHVHLVGKASDDKKYAVQVAASILSKYVGAYEFSFPENPTLVITSNVTLSGGELFMDTEGKDKISMIPLSETLFSLLGDRIEFVKDAQGRVTHFVSFAAEGNLKSVRRPDRKADK
jgi:hypothetical protein